MGTHKIGNNKIMKQEVENHGMSKQKKKNDEISTQEEEDYQNAEQSKNVLQKYTHEIKEKEISGQGKNEKNIKRTREMIENHRKQDINTQKLIDEDTLEQYSSEEYLNTIEISDEEIMGHDQSRQYLNTFEISEEETIVQDKRNQHSNTKEINDKEAVVRQDKLEYDIKMIDVCDKKKIDVCDKKTIDVCDKKTIDVYDKKTIEQDNRKRAKNMKRISDQETMKPEKLEQNISNAKEGCFSNKISETLKNTKTRRKTRNDVDMERYLHLYPALQNFTNKYRNLMEETRKRMVLNDVENVFKKTDGVDIGYDNHSYLKTILKVIRKWLVLKSTPEEIAILESLRNEILEKLVTSKQEYSQIIKSRELMKANLITLLLIDLDSERQNDNNVQEPVHTEQIKEMQDMIANNYDENRFETEQKCDSCQTKEECEDVTKREMSTKEKWEWICKLSGNDLEEYVDPVEEEVYKGRIYSIMYGNIMLPSDVPDSYWNTVYRGRNANAVMNYLRLCDKYHKTQENKLLHFVKKLSPDYEHTDTALYFNNEQELCYIYYLQKLKENEKLYMSYVERMKEKSKDNVVPARSRYGTRIATGASKGRPHSDVYVYTENKRRNAAGHLDSHTNRKRKRTKYIIPLGEDEGSEMHLIEKEIAKYRFLPTGVFYSRVCKSFIANWICESNKKQVKVPFKLFEYGIEGGILLSIIARFLRLNNQSIVQNIYNEIPFEKKKEMLEMMKVQEDNDEFFATVISGCKGAESYLSVMNYYVDVKKNKVQGGQVKNGRLAGWKRRKLKYAACANVDYGSVESEYMCYTGFSMDYDGIREELGEELELEGEEVAVGEEEKEGAGVGTGTGTERKEEETSLEAMTPSSVMPKSERFSSVQNENTVIHRGRVLDQMLPGKSNFKGMEISSVKNAFREAKLFEPSSLKENKPTTSTMNSLTSIRPFTPLRKYNLERKKTKI